MQMDEDFLVKLDELRHLSVGFLLSLTQWVQGKRPIALRPRKARAGPHTQRHSSQTLAHEGGQRSATKLSKSNAHA